LNRESNDSKAIDATAADDSNAIVYDSNESIPGDEYEKFYQQYLYSLLPAIYQEYDAKENNVLYEFLKIIASQAVTIRRDIDGLLNNFFINSCEEWVIPYIADLIAAKVAPSSSSNSSRLDVEQTIRWRKLKGTRTGLEDVVRNTLNSEAKVREAFRYCSTSAHLGFLRDVANPTKGNTTNSNFVNLHDQDTLNSIGTENDALPHLIDVREPTPTNGWYNIKNLLLFVPQLNVYRIEGVEAKKTVEGRGGSKFYFSSFSRKDSSASKQPSSSTSYPSLSPSPPSPPPPPLSSTAFVTNNNNNNNNNSGISRNYDFPLYDLETGLRINANSFAQNPFDYFGHKRGMVIRINNILAACPNPPDFTPIEVGMSNDVIIGYSSSKTSSTKKGEDHIDFIGLHKEEGIRVIEPRKFEGSEKQFIIRLYSYPEDKQDPIEIANYDTSKIFSKPYHHLSHPKSKSRKIIPSGKILLSVETTSPPYLSPTFPGTVIAIRDSRPFLYVGEDNMHQDNRSSKYQNVLYVYLPDITLNHDERKYLFVDRSGSTYYAEKDYNERYGNKISKGQLARQACGQIFPPRQLTYSSEPLKNFAELNRIGGIKVVDAQKFKKASSSFQIEGIAVDKERNQSWKIGRMEITPEGPPRYSNEKEVWIRWTIQIGDNAKPDNDKKDSSIKESLVCHFKAKRLVLKNNSINDVVGTKEISYEEIISDLMPSEILRKGALGNGIGTYQASPRNEPAYNNSNTYEIVEVIVNVHSTYYIQEISQKIRRAIEEKPELHNVGELALRISVLKDESEKGKNVTSTFPLSEIIVTNSFDKSTLVYLPQLKFGTNEPKYYHLYVASDGSTSFEDNLSVPARESAGQIIPLPGKYPLQQRIPIYMNLAEDWESSDTNSVNLGELAIDPELGRFAFQRHDAPTWHNNAGITMPITVDYNYAFSHEIGAGTYDRRANLKRAATMWVSKNGHVPYHDALPSKTFQTIADALASAHDGDVIQIEDSSIYEENALSNVKLCRGDVTLQAANQRMPVIKLTNREFRLVFTGKMEPDDKSPASYKANGPTAFTLNGILITGGSLTLEGTFDKLALICSSIDPRHEVNENAGIQINSESSSSSDTPDTYATRIREKTSGRGEILLVRSITGGIIVDESVSRLALQDSIIDNSGGPAIHVKRIDKQAESSLKLEAERSTILGALSQSSADSQHQYLDLQDIHCQDVIFTDIIFTDRVNVRIKQQNHQRRIDEYNKRRRNTGSSITHCTISGKDDDEISNFAFRCTSESPIFVSTTFGHPAYMHLDQSTSKEILEGAQNTLEMGAFNKSDKPLRMRNLKIRLQEFLPLGIKSGMVYLY